MYSNPNKNLIQESFFHLLILESVNYILNKNIENKQKSLVY